MRSRICILAACCIAFLAVPVVLAQGTECPPCVSPCATPLPSTAIPEGLPITVHGAGQMATDPINLPAPISIAHFLHTGSGYFGVQVYIGDDHDLLVNSLGNYDGRRPLIASEPVILDIDADGPWGVEISGIVRSAQLTFSGHGDDVSGLFDPPNTTCYQFEHDGESYFGVWLHCAGGTELLQNEVGKVSGSGMVTFSDGPCFWEVEADGNWSILPK